MILLTAALHGPLSILHCIAWSTKHASLHQHFVSPPCWRWHCSSICRTGGFVQVKALENALSESIEIDARRVTE